MTPPSAGRLEPDREFLLSYERLYGEWLRAEQAASAAERAVQRDAEAPEAPAAQRESAARLRATALEKLAALVRAVREYPL